MPNSKKLLQAAAGSAGGGSILENLSWQGTGDIPFTWLGANIASTNVMTYGDGGNKAYIGGKDVNINVIIRQFDLTTAYDPETLDLYNPTDLNIETHVSNPWGIEFKPDGTKMYILDQSSDTITEWNLSTAWDISTATYDSELTLDATYNTNPRSFSFDNIGRHIFVVESATNPDQIITYQLSTNYDISTATFYSNDNVVGSTGFNSTKDIAWGDDGDKFYMPFSAGDGVQIGTVNASSSPYQVISVGAGSIIDLNDETNTPNSTFVRSQNGSNLYTYCSSYERVVLHNESGAKYPSSDYLCVQDESGDTLSVVNDIHLSPDGTKLYTVSQISDTVYEFALSTANDLSTATYTNSFNVNSSESGPYGMTVSNNGRHLYIVGINSDTIYRFALGTAFDLGSVNPATPVESLDINSVMNYPSALSMNDDDTEIFVQSYWGEVLKISLASANTLSGATIPTVPRISVNIVSENQPKALFFKSDGTKMYFVGNTNDLIYAMDLSTAWDVTTATYNNEKISVGGDETGPTGLFFKPDGTAVFFVGTSSDKVWEYTLNTAWDLSTAQGTGRTLSVNAQDGSPEGLFFKSDGTEVYVLGNSGDTVEQYTMSTAWRLNTATHTNTLSLSYPAAKTLTGVSFKSDGSKMYILNDSDDTLEQYSLTTAWDISTATYDEEFAWQFSEALSLQDLYFKPDGTKVYIADNTNDSVFEFDLDTAWDLSSIYFNVDSDAYLNLQVAAQYNADFPGGNSKTMFNGCFDSQGENYYVGSVGNIHRFSLPTAYSFTGATYEESKPIPFSPVYGVQVAPDDSQMYLSFAGSKGSIFALTF